MTSETVINIEKNGTNMNINLLDLLENLSRTPLNSFLQDNVTISVNPDEGWILRCADQHSTLIIQEGEFNIVDFSFSVVSFDNNSLASIARDLLCVGQLLGSLTIVPSSDTQGLVVYQATIARDIVSDFDRLDDFCSVVKSEFKGVLSKFRKLNGDEDWSLNADRFDEMLEEEGDNQEE